MTQKLTTMSVLYYSLICLYLWLLWYFARNKTLSSEFFFSKNQDKHLKKADVRFFYIRFIFKIVERRNQVSLCRGLTSQMLLTRKNLSLMNVSLRTQFISNHKNTVYIKIQKTFIDKSYTVSVVCILKYNINQH